jgi:acyl-CoA thioesterase-1
VRALVVACLAFLFAGPTLAEGQAPVPTTAVIAVLGDSLTSGLGVAADEAYPARLEARLASEGYAYRVVNAGVSGDTTAGGLRRVDWVLRAQPEVVVVALGANDGLRGQSPRAMRANLETIVTRLRAAGARVLLTGMRMPPNYGEAFTREFAAVFPDVALRTGAAFVSFPLDVVTDRGLIQPDGLHPNAAGHQVIADRLWPHLKPLLKRRPRPGP